MLVEGIKSFFSLDGKILEKQKPRGSSYHNMLYQELADNQYNPTTGLFCDGN